ncbi:hypothetical protein DSOUD_2768 [Desulfuromonas soudanensis]|uniref:Carboxypeptidase regulatory-like domain-containing protein n=2 Tax=Desulfuromonas soudanensis TaxID=1603606 RepID=A0A0M5IUC4_9BACT|nr:hypothetical protein DSOUD_2768 [Desulfuromonas soudanensis]
MKYGYLTVIIVFLFVVFYAPAAQALSVAKIVVKVMDEAGAPVNNAHLNIRFSSDSGTVIGFTDDNGIFEVKAISNDGVILGDITKDGYYESGLAHSFYVTRFGMWQPWGKELTVVMRPIVNPVPMYVRNHSFKVPVKGEEVGFDLEKADWVIPYGQGTKADFVFRIDQRYDDGNNFDCRLTLTFSNPLDGIQVINDDGGGDFNVGSRYHLPRTAPEIGYLSKLQKRNSTGTPGYVLDMKDDNNYIFRVRSEVDENGKLKRAMYGKIRGDLWYTPGDGGKISLHYFLNPDYTRNLEFDPKRNLFIILSGSENVRQP